MMKPFSIRNKAFSLVEVVLALGVVAFAFMSVLGLLPVGLNTFRQSMDTAVSSQIAQRILSEAIQTDFNTLIDNAHLIRDGQGDVVPPNFTFLGPEVVSASNGEAWRYFDEQGSELPSSEIAKAIYHVLTRINPQVPLPGEGSEQDLRGLAQVTVQVVNNPGGRVIPLSPSDAADQSRPLRNLVDPSKGFPTYTVVALVPRNK